jgi:hypothetical protein
MCVGVRVLVLVGLGTAAGCGDGKGSGAAACLQVQPCGGDVVGTWSLVGGCVNTDLLVGDLTAQCPAWTTSATIDISGTATFGTELSYSFDGAETLTISQHIPLSCTTFAGCADVQADLATSMSSAVVTCTGTTTCDCVSTESTPHKVVTGTYATSGSSIVLTSASSMMMNNDVYCVQGDTLHLMSSVTKNGQMVIAVDDVLERQSR